MYESVYRHEFTPLIRSTDLYCQEAKDLVRAAEILEEEVNRRGLFAKSTIAPNLKVAVTLAKWFRHKAELLDQHSQLWDYSRAHPEAEVFRRYPVQTTSEKFPEALRTAREVIHAYASQIGEPKRKASLREIFRRPGTRKSESDS